MKIVCLDAKTLGDDVDFSEISKFGEFVSYDQTSPEFVKERISGAQIIITNKVIIDEELMKNSELRLICVSATGTNNIDLEAAKTHNITVKNVAGYSTNSVVQQTFATLFQILNKTPIYADYVKNKEWIKSDIFTHLGEPIYELNGKEFGIIGLGNIGRKVAMIAEAFGAKVRYYSTSGQNTNDKFIRVSLDSLLRTSDIISIHAPLNENTRNLISANELGKMKNGAIIMNFGRGGIIDEMALAKAIDDKNLKAGLDVLESEPMLENNPLLSVKKSENLIITPHIAWASVEARKILMQKIAKNIENFLKQI